MYSDTRAASESTLSNYLLIDSPPLPEGWTGDFAEESKEFFGLILRIFEMCDVMINADHNLLRCDNAGTMGLGSDVQRMYMTRAYRFNKWGLRSIAYLLTAIASMQTARSAIIDDLDTFVAGGDFDTFYALEFKSLFFDLAMQGGDISRPAAQRLVQFLTDIKTILDDNGVNGLIDDLESKLATFQTAREDLFAGVAEDLMLGNLPSVTWDPAAGIHIAAPYIKAIPTGLATLVCIICTSENCQRWKWVAALTREIMREQRECPEPDSPGN